MGDMIPMVTFGSPPILIHMGSMHTHMVHLHMDGEVPTDFQQLLILTNLVTLHTFRCALGTHILKIDGEALMDLQ
jgi:hypothetical protein